MDQKLFLERLSELAELKAIKPAISAATRAPAEPEEIVRHGRSVFLTKKDNPSWAYEIKKLKTESKPCDHCGRKVKNQVITRRLVNYPEPHWREKCQSCLMTKNPETGDFDLTEYRAGIVFTGFFRNKNK
jgi:hypothetical protein